jgi:type II secretory ATPase GspE/PulE/Tfp pilus assembly ATPase PilB-like protein
MMNEIAGLAIKTFSLENPTLYSHPYVTQVAIDTRVGYAETLKAVRRSDLDAVFVGDISDTETARAIVDLAITGHKVLTQIEALGLGETLAILSEAPIEPLLLARAIEGVIVQRLARRICPSCKKKIKASQSDPVLSRLRELARAGGYELPANAVFFQGLGCPECRNTGYKGRIGLYQVISWSEELSRALLEGDTEQCGRIAVSQGAPSVLADGVRKAVEGETTIDEVLRVTSPL